MVELHGDALGTILMRKFAGRSLAGIPGVNAFRAAINRAQTGEQFRDTWSRSAFGIPLSMGPR